MSGGFKAHPTVHPKVRSTVHNPMPQGDDPFPMEPIETGSYWDVLWGTREGAR